MFMKETQQQIEKRKEAIAFAEWIVMNGYKGNPAYLPLAMFSRNGDKARVSAASLYSNFKKKQSNENHNN